MRWTNTPLLLMALSGPCWGQAAAPAPKQPAPANTQSTTPVVHPVPKAEPKPEPKFVVVVDAAHGGSDTGARIGDRLQEKDITLAISIRLRSALTARGITTMTTREQDIALTPQARAETANRALASACFLLHASNSGVGVHLFVSPIAPTVQTKVTPWNSAQAIHIQKSQKLAGTLNGAFTQASVPVTLARAAVLPIDNLACPAVAVEVSPLPPANGEPAHALDNTEYQQQIVEALVAAILEWRNGERQP